MAFIITYNIYYMPLEFIEFKGKQYPKFQSEGWALQWIMPLAKYYCSGYGVDIGFKKSEWCFPGAHGIDPAFGDGDAMNICLYDLDYLISSHCLEHIKENIYTVLDYWLTRIKVGGIMFLYLPHKSQQYWHPENNRNHIHSLDQDEIGEYLRNLGHKVYVSPGPDHNNSFVVICEKVGYASGTADITQLANEIKERNDNRTLGFNAPKVKRDANDGKATITEGKKIEADFFQTTNGDAIWYNGKRWTTI
jgi:hypothetical protein